MDVPSDQNELIKRRFPGLPVYRVGTSRGTISAAVLGRELGAIAAALLFVHYREDGCEHTPYAAAARLAGGRYPLVSVSGGKPAQSGPCEPFAAHGYFGR